MHNRSLKINLLVVLSLLIFAFTIAVAASSPTLVGAFFVKGKVGLKWQAVDGATEYNIYRKSGDGEFVKLTTTEKTNHFDTQLEAGAVFTYKIAALVNGAEVEGNTKVVKLPTEIGGFTAPAGVEARVGNSGIGISLRWNAQKSAIAYNILRSNTQGSGYEIVGNVSANKYTDRDNVVAGTTYYYVITAMNEEFEESPYSAEKSVKFGLSAEEIKVLEEAESNIRLDSIDLEFVFDVTVADGDSLSNPSGIAMNSKGDLYITDQNRKRIICTDNNGKVKFTFGESMESTDRYDPPNGTFLAPFAIAIGNDDRVYVSDIVSYTIQIFSPEGKFLNQIRFPKVGDEGYVRPNGMTILPDDKILFCDVGNAKIVILNNDGSLYKEHKSSKTFMAHFPNGIAMVDANTFVYTNAVIGRIIKADLETGKEILSFGSAGTSLGSFGRAVGVAVSEDGLIWVSDAMGATIQAFNEAGEVKIAISNKMFSNDNEKLYKPRGFIVKDGMIYVATEKGNKIMAFNYKITKIEE